ncbi:hypothetical protein [Avibacterium paragallinarum]|uniref:hypothetical protein n=1 Tax=Avibacterium paragallinarum TaxID=728 RepID=UPI00397CAFB5
MGVIFIMLILVLGYYYTTNYIPAKIALKKSTGWEAYVHLCKYGLEFVIQGSIVAISIYLLLYVTSCLLNLSAVLFSIDHSFELHKSALDYNILSLSYLNVPMWLALVCFFSFAICKSDIKKKNENISQRYTDLGKSSGVLSVILESAITQIPVKISLKSKKVYVGIVDSEQFEQADIDNVTIIPYLSGYRDKDTLFIHFDCNYVDVYNKYKITIDGQEDGDHNLRHFRTVIRLSEVESISLFNPEYYDDFSKLEENAI